jgi:hypothetical protein
MDEGVVELQGSGSRIEWRNGKRASGIKHLKFKFKRFGRFVQNDIEIGEASIPHHRQ